MVKRYRSHGDGSATRRSDGRWQLTVTKPGGRRVYRTVPKAESARMTRRDADHALAAFVGELALGDPSSLTIGAYLRGWIDEVDVRPSTRRTYRMIVERHLIPDLGKLLLRELAPAHVGDYLRAKTREVSKRSVRHHHALLRSALSDAMPLGYVTRNVARLVTPPTVTERDIPRLDAGQARQLLGSLAGDRHLALVATALGTGLRLGELLGLAWEDVDLEAGTIRVRSTLGRYEGQWVLGSPKTARANRVVPLVPFVVDALREHRRRMALERRPEWRYHGLVFLTSNGEPLHQAEVGKALRVRLAAAGLPAVPFHSFRRSAASILAGAGVPARVVMAILGHATIRTTMDTYASVVDPQMREAIGALQEAIG